MRRKTSGTKHRGGCPKTARPTGAGKRSGGGEPIGSGGRGPARGDGGVRLTVRAPAKAGPASARLVEVCLRFGVPMAAPGREFAVDLAHAFQPGTVTLIAGPSGSGKSLLLNEIARLSPTSRLVLSVPFPLDVAVVDAVAPTRPMAEAIGVLTACGIGEPMLWIRRFRELSDGEKFRAKLARTVTLHRRTRSRAPLLCDEFGSLLHQRLAKATAFNLRKLATRERIALVIATSRDDLERDLQPDCVIRLGGESPIVEQQEANIVKPQAAHIKPFSLRRRLRIERGAIRDYEQFASMHYRQRDNMGFIDKVFVCREGVGGELLGIVTYGFPALELALRNRATCKRFQRNAKRLNRELRVLKRLVVHPDVRGCGLGHWLVRQTLPLVGTPFVECLAAMGVVNPVFEKAGMRCIGVCQAPSERDEIVGELRAMGADLLAADFVEQVRRRPAVRRLVTRGVRVWYQGMTGAGERRVTQHTPTTLAQTFRQLAGSQPVYYLWAKKVEGWALIDRGQRDITET